MRSEAEIRKQVEDHLKRRGLWVVDAGLWLLAVFFLWTFMPNVGLSTTFKGLTALFMVAWTGVLGAHTLRTIYVELREYLVRRAIERERRYYVMGDEYGKRKRDEAISRLEVGDDGELVDFPDREQDENYAQRSRNS